MKQPTKSALKDQLALAADTIIELREVDARRTVANAYLQRHVERLSERPLARLARWVRGVWA